ncbi:MucB/RseB C-terminal domain-containing protein [Thalassotalea atypica]|uniref:MucB/RseB C-terminal domain-containing protein n=1 Tax=Thalassotalea atypica TaxID=2054316 RepID=UPI002572C8BE|nr:MucB/RseB C-terminal domain-containing protein [Thalassotalea atypica]
MKLISSLLLLLSISFSVAAIENELAKTWLERLSVSLNKLNFNTSFVVVKNNQAEPYHWFHGVVEGNTELEILALLNGPRRDVLRKGQTVSYIEPEFPPYSVIADNISGPIPSVFSKDVSVLEQSYNFISVGRSRVLGRAAQLVRIVSKDEHRHGHWLWLDQESGLPLKLALITRKGQLLEQVQFTHLEITDQPAESLTQLNVAELPAVVEIPDAAVQKFAWKVNWLPDGFKRLKSDRHRITQTKQPVEFILFSDGLVDVSVYVGKSQDSQRAVDFARDGGTVVLNQVVDGFEISVVGKIPSKTAKIIADSVAFVAPISE